MSQIVSILLIAAVIVCPMWCDSGHCFCCADKMENDDRGLTVPASGSAPVCSCCEPERGPEGEQPPPPPFDPLLKLCQGICGGAVIEKPLELDDSLEGGLFVMWSSNVERLFPDSLSALQPLRHLSVVHPRSTSGRSLCTLHMSLLC